MYVMHVLLFSCVSGMEALGECFWGIVSGVVLICFYRSGLFINIFESNVRRMFNSLSGVSF